jgi:hypothetical protein
MVIDKSKINYEGVLSYVIKDDCVIIKDWIVKRGWLIIWNV